MWWLVIVLAVVIAGGYYAWSLRVHPWVRCRARGCKGGSRRDRVFKGAYGACRHCGGRGRKPRLGIRVLTPARAKAMTAPKGSHKKADHRKKG